MYSVLQSKQNNQERDSMKHLNLLNRSEKLIHGTFPPGRILSLLQPYFADNGIAFVIGLFQNGCQLRIEFIVLGFKFF